MVNNIVTLFTQSSEDPAKTSATLTGLLIMVSTYVQQLGVFIPFINEFYLSPIGSQMEQICTAMGMIVGGIWFLFGLFRKVTNSIEDRRGLRID